MDKKAIINIDLQPISDVANNLIDKLAEAIGWCATPKGNKARRLEAEEYLISQIKQNPSMPELAKAAAISRAKKLIKEYANQNSIVKLALPYLSEQSNPSGVNDDWLSFFMDSCKVVDDENIKIIWSKILAEECNNNGSVTKRLLNILHLISSDEAILFSQLLNFQLREGNDFENAEPNIFVGNRNIIGLYKNGGIDREDIMPLEHIGLLRYDILEGVMLDGASAVFSYFDTIIKVESDKGYIPFGFVSLTNEGKMLAKMISIQPMSGFIDQVKQYFYIHKCKVEIQKFDSE